MRNLLERMYTKKGKNCYHSFKIMSCDDSDHVYVDCTTTAEIRVCIDMIQIKVNDFHNVHHDSGVYVR